jgi:uncharacterized protein (TIGR02231 family)
MTKLVLSFIAALFVFDLSAQVAAKSIDAKITDVTVFMSGAQVTHSGNISLKEGENSFKLTDLTLYLDPNSVQVEGTSAYTILSVRHEVNYLIDQSSNPTVKGIMDSIEDLQFRQKEIGAMRDVYNDEINLIRSNNNIKGQNAVLIPEDLVEMADLFRSRLKEIRLKQLELSEQEKDASDNINRLQNRLNSINARKGTNPSEIYVNVIANKTGNAPIKISYLAQSAGWYPVYDLRAEDINSPIEFAYRAKVFQSTGNDWERVNLTISTGNPNIGGQVPSLYPWYVNIYQPIIYDKVENMNRKPVVAYDAAAAPAMAEGAYFKGEMDDEKTYTAANYTTVQNNTVNTEFKISIPYDIPSDNQQYDVVMQKQTLKAEYAYVSIPKLDNDAFLRAQLTDWSQYSLLPGESNIYFNGTFVGKGFIDPALANDTLNLSLGRDKAINIKREQVKDYCKTSFFGNKQQTSKAYEITVQNNKKVSVNLVIEDQMPISQNEEVEVEREEISGATIDETTGKLTWKVTLAPGETIKKQIRFNVKYPKKKYVSGL